MNYSFNKIVANTALISYSLLLTLLIFFSPAFPSLFSQDQGTFWDHNVVASNNRCTKKFGGAASQGDKICGKDTNPDLNLDPNTIYECKIGSGRGSAWEWKEVENCGSVGCTTQGSGASAFCNAESETPVDGTPEEPEFSPPVNKGCSSSSDAGNKMCGGDIGRTENRVYECLSRRGSYNWSMVETCSASCAYDSSTGQAFCSSVARGPTGPPPDAPPPPELDGMWEIIARGFNFFLGLIVVAVAAMFVYGAYMWMFSMGEPENVKRAQGILTWAVVGLVFYMIMRLILGFLLNLLGIDGLPGVTI